MRQDLLALTEDDLAALTNRGTVKRARRELDEAEVTGTPDTNDAGDVRVTWSDGIECSIPSGSALNQGTCSCAASSLCRHLIRLVLAYQQFHANSIRDEPRTSPLNPVSSWDPGTIPDAELASHYRPALFSKLKTTFRQGVLAEVVRGAKPTVRFFQPAAAVRFLVPGDPRYTHCDCSHPAPCPHVPLAVWACRELPAMQVSGIVSTAGRSKPVPQDWLDEVDAVLRDLLEVGLSGATQPWGDRLARLEANTRSLGSSWPADILAEITEQRDRYAKHDALFDPERLVALLGELRIRRDAMQCETGSIPQPMIRGTGLESIGQLGKCRLVGLGTGVRLGRQAVEVVTYLQDLDSGSISVITREYADPAKPAPGASSTSVLRSFPELGRIACIKQASQYQLGAGQLLTDSARRTAAGRLTLGRTNAAVQPQLFQWEQLPPPVLVESYSELSARLNLLPPSCLRPRCAAEDFHVLPVAGVQAAGFDVPTQMIVATLRDSVGLQVFLHHPFTERGRSGCERLLGQFQQTDASLRFVAGPVRRTPRGILVEPVACVFERASQRFCLQPWIEPASGDTNLASGELISRSPAKHPIEDQLRLVESALEQLVMTGVRRIGGDDIRRWQQFPTGLESVGLIGLASLTRAATAEFERKQRDLGWQPDTAVDRTIEWLALLRLARDVGWNDDG
jgi:hypothetical protein